jgi:hypothetical protein
VLVLVASQQQHTTNKLQKTNYKFYNNLQQAQTQRKQQHTQQSNGWGVFLFCGSPLFLSVSLVRFCVCAWSVTTINNNLQHKTTTINNNNKLQQSTTTKYKNTHTHQSSR